MNNRRASPAVSTEPIVVWLVLLIQRYQNELITYNNKMFLIFLWIGSVYSRGKPRGIKPYRLRLVKFMPSCVVLYHYYYPDDVVSSRQITDLAEGLYARGWQVKVFTGNRYCRKEGIISPVREERFTTVYISDVLSGLLFLNPIISADCWIVFV